MNYLHKIFFVKYFLKKFLLENCPIPVMLNIIMLTLLTIVGSIALVGICSWIIFLILMQKPSSNASMGASLGGGIAEAAFGGEASHVLTRLTVYGIIGFFACTLFLSLAHVYRYHHHKGEAELKPMDETALQSLTQLPADAHPSNVAASPAIKAGANSKAQSPVAVNKDAAAIDPATKAPKTAAGSKPQTHTTQSSTSKAKAQP